MSRSVRPGTATRSALPSLIGDARIRILTENAETAPADSADGTTSEPKVVHVSDAAFRQGANAGRCG